jgi:hypothetical protein
VLCPTTGHTLVTEFVFIFATPDTVMDNPHNLSDCTIEIYFLHTQRPENNAHTISAWLPSFPGLWLSY